VAAVAGRGPVFPIVWFLLKTASFIFFFIWLRGTLPRMRYDQFMRFGWKVLVPGALVWTMLVAGVRVLSLEVEDRRTTLITVLGVFAAVALVYAFLPAKEPVDDGDEPESMDDLAADVVPADEGGFPIPPLDLVVPPTPRSLQARRPATVGAPAAAGGVTGVDASTELTGVEPGDLERGTDSGSPHAQQPNEEN
jgi:NADH-quinone oxidoreductase subunit H